MADTILLASHKPALDSGEYSISVSQELKVHGNSLNTASPEIKFKVEGEKYSIDTLQIDSVFPPAAGMGDFSLLFPQIILNRSTLPWEREADKNPKPVLATDGKINIPWLALIILNEDETGDFENDVTKASVLNIRRTDWESTVAPTIFTKAKAGDTGELINIIVAKTDLLKNKILPVFEALPYLAHVRKTGDDEKAVVVCNRLPVADKKNTVHLVSLENSFATGAFDAKKDASGNSAIVTLKSWDFFCNDHFIISEEVIRSSQFSTELKNVLTTIAGSEYFRDTELISAVKAAVKTIEPSLAIDSLRNDIINAFRIGHLPDILKHLNRTPGTLRPNAEDDLSKQGFLKIPYIIRTGKRIDAVYRGPFIPVNDTGANNSIISNIHSDESLSYFSDTQKLNVSYASAWELGKMLALQNKNFSVELYKWKRNCYHTLKTGEALSKTEHAPLPIVRSWFNDPENFTGIINDLKVIPFNYLVPDPSLIPFESIRFFNIDKIWLKYFIDGAFSIGRISKAEQELDKQIYAVFDFLKPDSGSRSGLLLHSVAVAGWPDMYIYNQSTNNPMAANNPMAYYKCANESETKTFDKIVDIAYGANGQFAYKEAVTGTISFTNATFGDPAPNIAKAGYYRNPLPFRKDKLSPNILLCLFDGAIGNICINQKPGSIHFGLEDETKALNFNIKNLLPAITNNKNIATFAKNLIQKIEIIKFKV